MNKQLIAILGSGRSGKAAAQLAEQINIPTKILSDDTTTSTNNFIDCQLIVVSPGIPPSSPLYSEAIASGKEIISELEFAARHFPPKKYLAITGTNGKTTTTELTTHLLQALKVNAIAAGNIGHPFSSVVADIISGKLPKNTLPVIEVSSFQLERIDVFAPFAAVILNIAEDHLDRYSGGMEEYTYTKEKIFNKVVPANQIYGISCGLGKANSCFNDEKLISFDKLKLKGVHNQENVLAALELVSRVVDLDEKKKTILKEALQTYNPGKHRIEKILERNGITYIDDSKGTNPAAVVAALQSISGKDKNIRLILGGLDKGMDFSPLKDYQRRIKKVYIIGECREKIYDTLHETLNCEVFTSFDDCVKKACDEAVKGETVLLSPGCASWDMFDNYQERGKSFQKIIAAHQKKI